ncbi:DUF1036 domain-containing protein [Streptomyces sp. NPDC058618]|uniref:DUF1036 domain-containing protein n=1 Tax=Streptomyces sp. NPDC058618 TaxID=3346558 RepID=UPI003652A5B7
MGLYFKNSTSKTVWVAYAYSNSGCASEGAPWSKIGWFMVTPHTDAKVRSGPVNGAKYFYYAENQDRTLNWSGGFSTQLPDGAFDWCWTTGSTDSRLLGMRKTIAPVTSIDHTINLV